MDAVRGKVKIVPFISKYQNTTNFMRKWQTYVFNNTRAGASRDRGARPWVSSIAVIPNDQISAFASYCLPEMSSGAIQHG